ncbi:MAG: protein kinase [Ilumatobacter sp.]
MTFEIDGFTPIDILGQGGFGTVHRAADDAHGREVAIKVLGRITDDSARRRFDRERRAMGTLSGHPTIGIVHTSGFTKNEEPYIVMEMIRGGSLADRIEQDGPLPPNEVVELGVTLAEALDHAHEGGVLHLDLKPENILMSRFGQPKIVDFGIAALIDDESATSTIRATPSFADPMVLDGNPGTEQSDVYGLAATLFTLLEGTPPYSSGPAGLYQMMRRVATDPVPRIERDGVSRELSALLHRAMDKEPAGRPQTMNEFAALLRDVDAEPITARRPRRNAAVAPADTPGQLEGWPAGAQERPKLPGQVNAPRAEPPAARPHTPSDGADVVGGGPVVREPSIREPVAEPHPPHQPNPQSQPSPQPAAWSPTAAPTPQPAVVQPQALRQPTPQVASGAWQAPSATGTQRGGMATVAVLSTVAVVLAAVLAFALIQRNNAAENDTESVSTLDEGGETTEVDTTEPAVSTSVVEVGSAFDGRIPSVVGLTTEEATVVAQLSGYEVAIPAHCFDEVSTQSPGTGIDAEEGAVITFGYEPCVVPNFVGLPIAEAERIVNEEFVVGLVVEWPAHCDPTVLTQSVAAGEVVEPGTTVFLDLEDDCSG